MTASSSWAAPSATAQTLHVVQAADEDEVTARLGRDPWASAGLLRTGTIARWLLWLDSRPADPAR